MLNRMWQSVNQWLYPSVETRRERAFQQKVIAPLIKLQGMIKTGLTQLESKKATISAWTTETDVIKQQEVIRTELQQHDKQNGLVRFWKEWTGQVKDLSAKRTWLVCQECRPLLRIDVKTLEATKIVPTLNPRQLVGFTHYVSSWQSAIRRWYTGRSYYYKEVLPRTLAAVRPASVTRPTQRNSTSSLSSNIQSSLSKSMVPSSLPQIKQNLLSYREQTVNDFVFACGFLGKGVQNTTLGELRKAFLRFYREHHPDKGKHTNKKDETITTVDKKAYEEAITKAFQELPAELQRTFSMLNNNSDYNKNSFVNTKTYLKAEEITSLQLKGSMARRIFNLGRGITELNLNTRRANNLLGEVKADQANIRSGFADIRSGFADIRSGFADIRAGHKKIETNQRKTRQGINELNARIDAVEKTLDEREKKNILLDTSSTSVLQTKSLFHHQPASARSLDINRRPNVLALTPRRHSV